VTAVESRAPDPESRVFVETSARLHFGVLDLRGSLGRWFGGIGAAAPAPTLLVSAARADTLDTDGEHADRAAAFGRRFLDHYRVAGGAHVQVHRALPSHAGLGSGTQLGLAVARALAELYDITVDPPALARAVGRARRSAIGTWTFANGGLVVEGGRPREGDECGPLLARLPFPRDWRCVVAIPDAAPGISGKTEEEAFAQLPSPPEREVERVSHLVLMAVLPAVAEGDLESFGAALTRIQETTGRWFAAVQGSTFAPGPSEELVRRMAEWGACGVGQSSWGPTVYGIVQGDDAARQLADRVRDVFNGAGRVYEGAFPAEGARVWRAS
jgi:beta-ribofuranosylaminobenzene 5'-phosphate synthase